MIVEPECSKRNCVHFRGAVNDGSEATERVVCAAFPNKIPNAIAYGEIPHTEPFPGDRGIRYERGPNE